MKRLWTALLISLLTFAVVACGSSEGGGSGDAVTTDSGLQITITEEGDGAQPVAGDSVRVHYTGTLEDGTVFDSSLERSPFEFVIGQGQVIPGWDEGIAMLTEGSKATLVIPPELAYGDRGAGNVIPPGATLTFEVELLEIVAPLPPPLSIEEVGELDYEETDSGLQIAIIEQGDGPQPAAGQQVRVHYTGMLEDGTVFDSSLSRGPLQFPVGVGQVIPGWDEGIMALQEGTQAVIIIPSELGYGSAGAGGVIPPDATLIFEVFLVEVIGDS